MGHCHIGEESRVRAAERKEDTQRPNLRELWDGEAAVRAAGCMVMVGVAWESGVLQIFKLKAQAEQPL